MVGTCGRGPLTASVPSVQCKQGYLLTVNMKGKPRLLICSVFSFVCLRFGFKSIGSWKRYLIKMCDVTDTFQVGMCTFLKVFSRSHCS